MPIRRVSVSVCDRRVNRSTVFRQSMRASRTCDMPRSDREKCVIVCCSNGRPGNVTSHDQLSEVPFKDIDNREKDLHVEDELFGHSHRFQVLTAAHVS